MQWCLIGMALSAGLLGLAALTMRWPGVRHIQPGLILRGCMAMVCLLTAMCLISLALLSSR